MSFDSPLKSLPEWFSPHSDHVKSSWRRKRTQKPDPNGISVECEELQAGLIDAVSALQDETSHTSEILENSSSQLACLLHQLQTCAEKLNFLLSDLKFMECDIPHEACWRSTFESEKREPLLEVASFDSFVEIAPKRLAVRMLDFDFRQVSVRLPSNENRKVARALTTYYSTSRIRSRLTVHHPHEKLRLHSARDSLSARF